MLPTCPYRRRLVVSLDWPQEVHLFPSGVVEIIERQAQEVK
jgi:hypothetical protein